jgi:hypothetical protein
MNIIKDLKKILLRLYIIQFPERKLFFQVGFSKKKLIRKENQLLFI